MSVTQRCRFKFSIPTSIRRDQLHLTLRYPSDVAAIHPPHLDWAVRSERGEFLIVQQKDGTVKLLGTTWFHVKMRPECYWGWISDQMIHMIHTRVLSHIKQSVETDTMLSNSAVAK